MHIGNGQHISDRLIPVGESTGLVDINGKELKSGDTVELVGCTHNKAMVGFGFDDGRPGIYIGAPGGVYWGIDPATIQKHKITKSKHRIRQK